MYLVSIALQNRSIQNKSLYEWIPSSWIYTPNHLNTNLFGSESLHKLLKYERIRAKRDSLAKRFTCKGIHLRRDSSQVKGFRLKKLTLHGIISKGFTLKGYCMKGVLLTTLQLLYVDHLRITETAKMGVQKIHYFGKVEWVFLWSGFIITFILDLTNKSSSIHSEQ